MALTRTQTLSITGLGLVAAIAAVGSYGLFFRGAGVVQVCSDEKTCNNYTQMEYNAKRLELLTKWKNNESLTWQELQALIAIMDREAKERGGIKINSTKGQNTFRSKITNFLTE